MALRSRASEALAACESCRFYVPHEGRKPGGLCRRLPPAPQAIAGSFLSRFPAVRADWWCGEYQAAKK